jgi:hypothetical protein
MEGISANWRDSALPVHVAPGASVFSLPNGETLVVLAQRVAATKSAIYRALIERAKAAGGQSDLVDALSSDYPLAEIWFALDVLLRKEILVVGRSHERAGESPPRWPLVRDLAARTSSARKLPRLAATSVDHPDVRALARRIETLVGRSSPLHTADRMTTVFITDDYGRQDVWRRIDELTISGDLLVVEASPEFVRIGPLLGPTTRLCWHSFIRHVRVG